MVIYAQSLLAVKDLIVIELIWAIVNHLFFMLQDIQNAKARICSTHDAIEDYFIATLFSRLLPGFNYVFQMLSSSGYRFKPPQRRKRVYVKKEAPFPVPIQSYTGEPAAQVHKILSCCRTKSWMAGPELREKFCFSL